MVRLSRRTVAGECNRQNVLPSSTLGDFLLHRNQVLALSTLNTNFVGGVESKKEDRIGVSLIHVTPDDFMTVAGLRCAAFTGGADHQRFIDNRFALFQASKTRHELGNIIIAARCNLSLLSLELIAKSAELRTEKDKLAYDQVTALVFLSLLLQWPCTCTSSRCPCKFLLSGNDTSDLNIMCVGTENAFRVGKFDRPSDMMLLFCCR